MKVGIPRAMLFHHYGENWLAFLEALGVEPVVSGATTGEMISTGAVHADNETCLPVKVFSGHLMWLKEEVDAILGNQRAPRDLRLPQVHGAARPGAVAFPGPATGAGPQDGPGRLALSLGS